MQQLTINVPDDKVQFFRELVGNLGFTIVKTSLEFSLNEEQIALVNAEQEKITREPDNFIDWEAARKLLSHNTNRKQK
ncbi:MAG: hypothetical protein KF744_00630 [Taibaiella sp.]|nr:hypothetical protein [Taibaiella sp.]